MGSVVINTPVSPSVHEMEGIIYAIGSILFLQCLLGTVYVPCINCMLGGVIVGDSGLCCCCCVPVVCVMSAVVSIITCLCWLLSGSAGVRVT